MATIQRVHLGPETSPIQQGRGTHGRWRIAYQQAGVEPEEGQPVSVVMTFVQDADRLAFALAEGPAAEELSHQLGDFLWMRDSANGDWPLNLREWLADTARWTGAPSGRTAFICGRLERNVAGGRVYLAWLGMSGVRLLDRNEGDVTLDTIIGDDEGWTPEHGPEPVGMGLHAYRGSLFSLDRLIVVSTAALPLRDDLPDLPLRDLEQALEDWGEESDRALAVLDLRLNQVLSKPNSITLNYNWIAPDLCLLSWHPSPNVTGYRLEEAPTSAFDEPATVAEMTDGRQVQYRLSPPSSIVRYYRVIPLNQGVPGTPSESICPIPMILPAPILETITWGTDGGYYLHWTAIAQATSYEVQRSTDADFDSNTSEVVYRGEVSEVYLPPEAPPNLFYRVRAINVLYAPNNPSPWSQPLRSPARLDKPTFTRVTQKRIEWTPVPGARQYMVQVGVPGEDEARAEEIFVIDPLCGVADQPATYRVRALRRPDDLRTVSEWSESVLVSPPKTNTGPRRPDLRPMLPLLLGAALVALLVGIGLGLGALRAYQEANASSTPTPLQATAIQATNAAATFNAMNATSVDRMETEVRLTAISFRDQTATATQWTLTPTPTATFTPSKTPNLTETIEMAFQAGQTATAAGWTLTPSPTATFTPSITPNLTETIERAFQAGQTATAAGWTLTPTPTATFTPSITPNLTATLDTMIQAHLTALAAAWTSTPTATRTPVPSATLKPSATVAPSDIPDLTETVEAMVQAQLTALAAGWTPTPRPSQAPQPSETPNATATAEALILSHLTTGCFVINLPDLPLPVYTAPRESGTPLLPTAPRLAAVTQRRETPEGSGIIWLQVRIASGSSEIVGWVRVPDGVAEADLYTGHDCPWHKGKTMADASHDQKQRHLITQVLYGLILLATLALICLASLMVVLQIISLHNKENKAAERDVSITVVLPAGQSASTPTGDTAAVQLDPQQAADLKLGAAAQTLAEADQAKQDAQDSVNTVSMLLSFLEGAAVLAGLALGAAAYFGFRNSSESKEDVDQALQDLEKTKTGLNDQMQTIKGENEVLKKSLSNEVKIVADSKAQLTELPARLKGLENLKEGLDHWQSEFEQRLQDTLQDTRLIFVNLVQANQELTLKNFNEVYRAVSRVLEIQPDNSLALYMAGWIELQYIENKLDEGLKHLKQAWELDPDWPSAIAAYGVALRRQALHLTGDERDARMSEAETHLRRALNLNHTLLDLNMESFWGPVAGISRDEGEIDKAIGSYEKACGVTPGSSYPHGNLAALYLRKSKEKADVAAREKALDVFDKTARLAQTELSNIPNDYFHVMDIAMSRLMLTQRNPGELAVAEEMFRAAVALQPTAEMLTVSQRGWQNLVDYCPDDWVDLKARLTDKLAQITQAIAATQSAAQL